MNNFIEPRNWLVKDYAIEWWNRDGHFNEELYLSVLIQKQQVIDNRIINHKTKDDNEQHRRNKFFFRFLPFRKWLGIEKHDLAKA